MSATRTVGLTTFLVTAIASALAFGAQTDADHVMELVRSQIVSLRVWGDKNPQAKWPDNEPPVWGTGFIVPESESESSGRLRILTAAHVVQPDSYWARRGNGVARTIYPRVFSIGASELEGVRGVIVNPTEDIAQVVALRNVSPLKIRNGLNTDERYFVASWGLDDAWGGPTEEPYIKEVKYLDSDSAVPAVPAGLALFEALPNQSNHEFKQSESGSPVVDMNGNVLAVVVQERVDLKTGKAVQALAIPLTRVIAWLSGKEQAQLIEPAKVSFTAFNKADATIPYFMDSLAGSCVFLGKYSARRLSPNSDAAKRDAPLGIETLQSIIRQFPVMNPENVTDEQASISRDLAEPRVVRVATPDGEVHIRSNCPDVVAKPRRQEPWERIAYYAPVIATVSTAYRVTIQQILQKAYLRDFFYWGVVNKVEPLN